MIQEWFEYVRTDAPTWARERGLVYESIALRARLNRQAPHWQSHLKNSQQEIKTFLSKFPYKKRVIVFGSGYLMEFPKPVIQDKTRSFILVDAVHPREIQKQLRAATNVELLNLDLAQNAVSIYPHLERAIDADTLVISCNLLSQLPLSIVNGKDPAVDKEKTQLVIREHISLLRKMRCPVLLLSDFERSFRCSKGNVLERENTLPGLDLGSPDRHWTWNWAPQGELSMEYAAELEVGKWELNVSN